MSSVRRGEREGWAEGWSEATAKATSNILSSRFARNPLAHRSFAIVDTVQGIGVYNYEGRQLSTPRFQGLRPDFLSSDGLSLSSDVVAILDQTDFKTIRCFDALTGRPLGSGAEIKHDQEITKIALSQFGTSSMDRRLAFIDSNKVRKAASVVSCIMR